MKERGILFSAPMVLALLAGTKTQTRRIVKAKHLDCADRWAFDPERGEWESGEVHQGPTAHVEWVKCPYGVAGDRLWVRETWAYNGQCSKNYGPKKERREGYVTYAADGKHVTSFHGEGPMLPSPKQSVPPQIDGEDDYDHEDRKADYYRKYFSCWRPSIFMPRWASRITLEVTGVRVERLQDISEADALAEGCEPMVHESWSVWDPACEATVSMTVEPDAEYIARHRLEDVRHVGPKTIATAADRFCVLWDAINGPGSASKNPWVWCVSFRRVAP